MSPEEHLRRLRRDEAWSFDAAEGSAARPLAPSRSKQFDRRQVWTTVMVAAAVVIVAGVVINVVPSRGAGTSGPAGPVGTTSLDTSPSPVPAVPSDEATPAPTAASPVPGITTGGPTPEPASTATPLAVEASPVPGDGRAAAGPVATSHGSRAALEFVAADPEDVARGGRAVSCLQAKGVEFVDLAAPDSEGVRYLEFGGPRNDRRSISLGLQFADDCIAAAAH